MNEFEVARILVEHLSKVREDELRAAYPGKNIIIGPVPKYPRCTIVVRDDDARASCTANASRASTRW